MDPETKKIIDQIIVSEGGSLVTDDPIDAGGRTQFGIAEQSHPEVWKDGKVTREEAEDIYFKKYVQGPGFDKVESLTLKHQLVDFGVLSGPSVAIKALQRALKLKEDGILGPNTLETISKVESRTLNNALTKERVKLLGNLCVKRPSQLKFLNGWLNRALEFII